MTRAARIAILAAAMAALCVAIVQLWPPLDTETAGASAESTVPPPREAGAAAGDAGNVQEAMLAAYFENFSFRDELAGFIDDATQRRMSRADRQRRADELLHELRALEANGTLVPAQSLFAQAAVLKALHADDPERIRYEIEALQARYEESRVEPSMAHLDERFRRYKDREREIVDEVLSGTAHLNGLSREAYLRERLNEARAEIYAETGE